MEKDRQEADTSQFFLVRLWLGNPKKDGGPRGEGENQVQGKVQHVLSGQAASFDDWRSLMEVLKGMTQDAAEQQARTHKQDSN